MTEEDKSTQDPTFSITYSPPKTYEEGYANGFQDAWIKCWEYLTELYSSDAIKISEEPTK